ncbi:MAG: type II toxin-antitoxin system Phd/YefM family antitoxin [Ardenticatenaceae bacterium]|nr:type II toxin-antitoxin system Phd/YefM family antitoxin [Anaerolineales bacterium]MCB8922957.1 type II toxin-antitoxin system Phd/YefM family antitoxin [Ardenticatenaceae bacterium]MCB8990310.1 type II toxin-antitoxin system Phd/YefM family antitoxin [Ardenticatenaceae bacterium]
METILSKYSASISELKKNPTALLAEADGEPIAILNRNIPTAYLIPAAVYEAMLERLEDYELGQIVQERMAEKDNAVEVDINDL